MLSGQKLRAIIQTKMTFNTFVKEICRRTGPAYGAGPAGFKRLMKRLGNPQNSYQIIHVAGTNGKGSICYLCAEILKSAGYKTGLFISPHLQSPTERIQINGKQIAQADLIRLCKQVLAAEEEKLNFFEILTAAAFLYFAEKKASWIVLETGLGGRKDPTNSCKPAACVISSVGLDHCEILGSTLAQIACEKAGIIKRGVPIFCPSLSCESMREICKIADEKKAPLYVVKNNLPFELAKINWSNSEMILRKGKERWPLHLLGEKQIQNACLVYHLCCRLGLPEKAVKQGFACVQIPGRFEKVTYGGKIIVLDGAHNPQAIENLMKFLQKSPWKNKVAVVCSFMADKDYPAMSQLLAKQTKACYISTTGGTRAATLAQLKESMPLGVRADYFRTPIEALRAALKEYSVVLVTGSFYLVANIRTRLLAPARKKKRLTGPSNCDLI